VCVVCVRVCALCGCVFHVCVCVFHVCVCVRVLPPLLSLVVSPLILVVPAVFISCLLYFRLFLSVHLVALASISYPRFISSTHTLDSISSISSPGFTTTQWVWVYVLCVSECVCAYVLVVCVCCGCVVCVCVCASGVCVLVYI
jgi:hypothetical protein